MSSQINSPNESSNKLTLPDLGLLASSAARGR